MKVSGSPALIAAQLYASSAVQARDGANAQATRRQAAKFEIKDDVAVRADRVEDPVPKFRAHSTADAQKQAAQERQAAEERGEGVGRREAPLEKQERRRPGSLVDLTA